MHLNFRTSILDYMHLTPLSWSITTITMKLCSILFTLLDIDETGRLKEYQIRGLLTYLTNITENQMATLFYKLGSMLVRISFIFVLHDRSFSLDLNRSGTMEIEEFFILIALLIANKVRQVLRPAKKDFHPNFQDKKEKEFMHAHSKTVFDILDEDNSGTISVEEFRRLGFLFDLDNQRIRTIFRQFDISGDEALDFSEFRVFTLVCINNQKLLKKKRLKYLLQRRLNFLAESRRPVVELLNKTIDGLVP